LINSIIINKRGLHMPSNDLNNDGKISRLELFPYWFDRLRIFPRAFITVYIYMFYNVVEWFMALPEPNNAQAGLVSVVVGAGAAWFGLYVNSTSENKQPVMVSTTGNITGNSGSSYQGSASNTATYSSPEDTNAEYEAGKQIKSRY
jgi:hypothetical protein